MQLDVGGEGYSLPGAAGATDGPAWNWVDRASSMGSGWLSFGAQADRAGVVGGGFATSLEFGQGSSHFRLIHRGQPIPNLGEGEALPLEGLDEAEPIDIRLAVEKHLSPGARSGHQPFMLIKPYGTDSYTCFIGQVLDLEVIGVGQHDGYYTV